ncbi:MAG TPA: hypothetical protein VGK74_29310 [Symbiobacteriaceae bacterium]|jgi:hypothetical protein
MSWTSVFVAADSEFVPPDGFLERVAEVLRAHGVIGDLVSDQEPGRVSVTYGPGPKTTELSEFGRCDFISVYVSGEPEMLWDSEGPWWESRFFVELREFGTEAESIREILERELQIPCLTAKYAYVM